MGNCAGQSVARPRRRGPVAALAVVAVAALCAGAASAPLGGCGSVSHIAPATTPSPHASDASSQATGAPSAGIPSPVPVVTAGPVPPAAAAAATRYWRLIDTHRYRALLTVVTRDSQAAAALRAGRSTSFWGIERVRVVSVDPTLFPEPAAGATLEFGMTVDVRPIGATAWNPGRNLVFMSLRRVGASWLVYETGSGP